MRLTYFCIRHARVSFPLFSLTYLLIMLQRQLIRMFHRFSVKLYLLPKVVLNSMTESATLGNIRIHTAPAGSEAMDQTNE